ncbi:MAG: ArsC family reductase [Burkholderiaceae bacterium]|nr:ArsC family reductase [Burkholderiaceae bacterium]
MTASLTLYGIPNCDTVKRARAWLAGQGAEVAFHDFKKAGVPADRLDGWIAALGWERLVNRQGTSWRRLDGPTQAAVVDAASARALMLAQPSVIKRPVVAWPDGTTTVGFDADDFSRRL